MILAGPLEKNSKAQILVLAGKIRHPRHKEVSGEGPRTEVP